MTEDQRALDLLDRALAHMRAVVAGVNAEQEALPTPCRSWNVGELIAHLVRDLQVFEGMARGGDWRPGDPERVSPDGWRGAVDEGAHRLMAAWRARDELTDQDLQRVSLQTAEFAVHTWDLARATRQPMVIDAEVAEAALAWSQRNLKPDHRGEELNGKAFGPEVVIAATAPAGDRLAAWMGRDPAALPLQAP